MRTVYDTLYQVMDYHADAFLIMGGDFNACMNVETDSLNIVKSDNESKFTDYIKSNNETCEIADAFREKWNRQQCFSRLD